MRFRGAPDVRLFGFKRVGPAADGVRELFLHMGSLDLRNSMRYCTPLD